LSFRDKGDAITGTADDLNDMRNSAGAWVILGPIASALPETDGGIRRQGVQGDPVTFQDPARPSFKFLDYVV
jgi:hypothetical protein